MNKIPLTQAVWYLPYDTTKNKPYSLQMTVSDIPDIVPTFNTQERNYLNRGGQNEERANLNYYGQNEIDINDLTSSERRMLFGTPPGGSPMVSDKSYYQTRALQTLKPPSIEYTKHEPIFRSQRSYNAQLQQLANDKNSPYVIDAQGVPHLKTDIYNINPYTSHIERAVFTTQNPHGKAMYSMHGARSATNTPNAYAIKQLLNSLRRERKPKRALYESSNSPAIKKKRLYQGSPMTSIRRGRSVMNTPNAYAIKQLMNSLSRKRIPKRLVREKEQYNNRRKRRR